MKQTYNPWRRLLTAVLAVVLAVGLCLSLGGCQALEDARAQHAVWGDADHQTIRFRDQVYRLVPQNDNLQKLETALNFGDDLRVTDPDVPVLLADMYGMWMDANPDGTVLVVPVGFDSFFYDYSSLAYYCREDRYEELVQQLEDLRMDHYCRIGYRYQEDINTYRQTYELLTESQADALGKALDAAEPLLYTDPLFFAGNTTICRCDASMWFTEDLCGLNRYCTEEGKIVCYTLTVLDRAEEYVVPESLWNELAPLLD